LSESLCAVHSVHAQLCYSVHRYQFFSTTILFNEATTTTEFLLNTVSTRMVPKQRLSAVCHQQTPQFIHPFTNTK